MACGPKCACEPGVECLSVLDPVRFGFFKEWCESGDPIKRIHVRNRSRLGLIPDLSDQPIHDPSFFQKATNFGRAITQHLAAGLPHTDEATVARRLSICQVCEYFDATRTACRKCGCYMEVKVKWAEQKCPIGKW